MLNHRNKRRADGKKENDLIKSAKVFGILVFLLLVLYLLSFSMEQNKSNSSVVVIPSNLDDGEAEEVLSDGETDSNEVDLEELPMASHVEVPVVIEKSEDEVLEEMNQAQNLYTVLGDEDDQNDNTEAYQAGNVYHPTTPFYIDRIPGVKGVRVVNGNLTNAYRFSKRDEIKTRYDLPAVFPVDVRIFRRTVKGKRPVCVFTRTPRQDSLFKTNILSMFGSGEYNYVILRSTQCQHEGSCPSGEVARTHPKCKPDVEPTIHLNERVKNFQFERFAQDLSNGLEYYDVMVATGDEFCRATNTFGRAHFRTYAGPNVVNASLQTPIYLPLGPREEFERVLPREIRLVRDRKYVFNFLGSLTSPARRDLTKVVRSQLKKHKSFLHIIAKWSKKLTANNGYVPPGQYKQVLLRSIFTLCPQGHNPEAYRIYEACEAGSIPIIVLDSYYRQHECKSSFAPLLQQGAPFVVLNDWTELPAFLDMIVKYPARIQQMQADTMAWYSQFMKKVAKSFENVLELRFQDRMDRGDFTSTKTLEYIEAYLSDPKYTKPLPSFS